VSSALLVAGAANLDRMMTLERIPEPGETMMALKYEEHPGGKGGNQAAAAAIWGQPVYFMGRVGRDEPGEILRNALEKAGVNTNFLIESSSSSGIALDFIDLEGTYQAAVYAGANAGLSAADVPADESLWESLGFTVIQLECPLAFNEAIGQKSREYGVPVLLNAAPALDFPESWWDWINVLVVNELEAESYAGVKIHDLEDARSSIGILQEKCRKTVISLGDKGLLAANGLSIEHIPAHSVEVVSTLGAGDAFVGVFAAELCRGEDFFTSAQNASHAAAASVCSSGAQSSYLSPQQVLKHPVLGTSFRQLKRKTKLS